MLPAKSTAVPYLHPAKPERTAETLRKEISAHNRRVISIVLFTIFVATALWLILYALCCWAVLFSLSVVDAPDISVPRGFTIVFAVAAVCAIGYAWIDRRLTPNEGPRDDKSRLEVFSDIVLALPRITLSIWGTLRAWLKLGDDEREIAAAFLHRLARERRVPMQSVPLDIPDAAMRFRILFALQITEVIELRRDERETWIVLNSSRPRALRLGAPRADAA